MTSLKLTKRALLSSVIALFLCFAMLIGTTFAWFTDSVVSANNKIVSGELDIELYLWSGDVTDGRENATAISTNSAPVFPDDILWEPGYTEVVYLSIKNEGNLALKYKVALEVTDYSIPSLLEVMSYTITPDAKFGSVTSWAGNGIYVDNRYHETDAKNVPLLPGEEHFFALSVHMDEEAGNEYMNQSIEFDIKVLAGQLASESDSFDNTYDKNATYAGGSASATIPDNGEPLELEIRDDYGSKTASFLFPADSLSDTATDVVVTVDRTTSQNRYDFEIKVEGLADNNTVPVKVQLRIPAGLDSTDIVLTHNDQPIQSFVYNPVTGYVIFETTSFSPFAVDFDPSKLVDYNAENFPGDVPTANVTDVSGEYVGNIEWDAYGPFDRLDNAQQLECAFLFTAPHTSATVESSAYADWLCDYVVSIDRNIDVDSIVLGGNYGGFGWVGFYNPIEITANEEIPLLGSFFGAENGNTWTYEMVVDLVSEFLCGVGEANNPATDLDGATFTVRLRLTNPENSAEVCDVNVVRYTFADPAKGQAAKIVIEDFTADLTTGN